MTDHDRGTRRIREDATETRLQADPMLRPGRAPYAWPIAIALAVLAIAVVLFATNQDDTDVADTGTPAVTTGAAPPETKADSATANAPANPGTNDAPQNRAPPAGGTTGSAQ